MAVNTWETVDNPKAFIKLLNELCFPNWPISISLNIKTILAQIPRHIGKVKVTVNGLMSWSFCKCCWTWWILWCYVYKFMYYYSLLHLSGIGEYRKGSSPSVSQTVCLSVYLRTFLQDGRVDFLYIRYHDQVPQATDIYINYNLALYQIWAIMAIFPYILSVYCDIIEKNVFILFIFSTVIRYHRWLMLVK